MAALKWARGRTAYQLAEKWGLSHKTVETWSAEASRQLRESPEELEDLRREWILGSMTMLVDVRERAERHEKKHPKLAVANERVAVSLLRVLLRDCQSAQDDLTECSDQELAALLERATGGSREGHGGNGGQGPPAPAGPATGATGSGEPPDAAGGGEPAS